MLIRVNGELVHQLFLVAPRARSAARLAQLDGAHVRARYGWQLAGEENGVYAGEAAMVIEPPGAAPVPWIASGDLHLIDETAATAAPQLPLEAAAE